MNKGLYKRQDHNCIYWYKTWENSTKNSGATMVIWDYSPKDNYWTWVDYEAVEEDSGDLVGAACLAQW